MVILDEHWASIQRTQDVQKVLKMLSERLLRRICVTYVHHVVNHGCCL